jgi:hypothetical protein
VPDLFLRRSPWPGVFSSSRENVKDKVITQYRERRLVDTAVAC